VCLRLFKRQKVMTVGLRTEDRAYVQAPRGGWGIECENEGVRVSIRVSAFIRQVCK
jgi:hypothetical protein